MIPIDLSGKRAIVTGVTSGLGLGISVALSRAGAIVYGCGRTPESDSPVLSYRAQTGEVGVPGLYQACDVRDGDALVEFVGQAARTLGGIDIVVSNAGANRFETPDACTIESWQRNLDLNLRSHWLLAKSARPHLERSGSGVILVITSNHGLATMKGCFPYNVAKTGLFGLVRALAIDWGPAIRTVGIAPGFVWTGASEQWFDSFADSAEALRSTIARHPVGRLGTVEDIGSLCCFLASPLAGFITGTTIVADGGRTAILED